MRARTLFLSFLFVLAGSFGSNGVASADEVVLVTGDRLSGRIVSHSSEELQLETREGETVKIKWSEIASVTTDRPVDQVMTDGASQLKPTRGLLSTLPESENT
jgi:hypothetical protein